MSPVRSSKLLRTTVVQAFARTIPGSSGLPDELAERASGDEDPASSLENLPSVGDVVGGHYKLVSLLGQGMFGRVYVAERIDVPEHRVALKLMPRSLYVGRNVERELVMLATVGHPNVVQLKDHGMTPDYVWLTMPVYQGETLAQRLERGPLGLREAHDIFLAVARGLEALHMAGLRHQDVKPDNLFLAVFGGRIHPVLLDLGVAAERDASFVAGTALFGAPEQVNVLGGMPIVTPLSEKMDTYGLAATLLVSLVGPRHFPGETATDRSDLAVAHAERQSQPLGPAALPDLVGEPRELVASAFRRWLAFDPDERPGMPELCEQLEVLLEPEREAEREEERRRTRQRTTIQRFKAVFGAMILIGLGVAGVAYSKRETLQVAAALDAARREGAQSFDKLDTCIASDRLAKAEASSCSALREHERTDFKKSLDEVMKTGTSTEQDRAREAQAHNSRLRLCEDNAATARRTCDEQATREFADNAKARATLTMERDEARQSADARKGEVEAAGAERDRCRVERQECVDEREGLRAAARAAQVSRPGGSIGGGPAPAPSGAVLADPGAPPKATSSPPGDAPAPPPPAPSGAPAPPAGPAPPPPAAQPTAP